MFWDSVIGGLEVLTFWETYVAGLVYLLIFMVPMALMGLTMKEGMAAGCVSMLVIPVFQAAAVAVFVLTLAPIIFGFAEDAAWSFPWVVISMLPGMFIKLVGTLVLSAIGVSFVPLIGQMRSLHTLVLGGIALLFVLKIFGSLYPEVDLGKLDSSSWILVHIWIAYHRWLNGLGGDSCCIDSCYCWQSQFRRHQHVTNVPSCSNFRLYPPVHLRSMDWKPAQEWPLNNGF